MIKNEGMNDRIIRGIAGAVILFLGFFYLSGIWQAALMGVGLILLLTAVSGFCALYSLLGINTNKQKQDH
jgi:hypothetical protein